MADGSVPQLEGRSQESGRFVAGCAGGPGRQSRYSQELADYICDETAKGRSLRSICEDRPDFLNGAPMVNHTTVIKWSLDQNCPFFQQFAQASQVKFLGMADELTDIADDGRNDFMLRQRENGEPMLVADNEAIQRSKVRIDTRKWVLSKMLPKVFGERVENRLAGADGGAIKVENVADPVAMARQIAYMLTRATAEPAVIENDEPEPT